ncbi:hypothetical protein FF098_010335 [Parvularcula flava]|uniref:Uncharacterized protein n=1 Tax=Aquisalinus luteolus TaxID=1566827 RepID=A0A8J3ER65_9PROT|nr:hypothetical protein [Aquisalinus luteolus]NHK28303.1 hypothetical protein [Aquisalinus luteolus]GGH98072.1 hypothetical protein GCM10011355_20800 [Aquisalinus luteolus]
MRFFGNIFAWVLASAIAYAFASIFQTQMVLAQLADLGATITFDTRLETTLSDLAGLWLYSIVIATGFAIGFFVASLVKALLPFLSPIAYIVAGVASLALALFLMEVFVPGNEIPISSAQRTTGYILQLVAAGIGGLVFELARPKRD